MLKLLFCKERIINKSIIFKENMIIRLEAAPVSIVTLSKVRIRIKRRQDRLVLLIFRKLIST